ncbi:DUF2891 family protein [Corynebacterium fournieri]|uniref:DUF2891 family protein n=1 Tax=Corynebacterium fournieri TaxID=1852390 RepID=UPI000A2EFFFF|nr:DUF2891 family protein [Corynebacterium fournieri]WJY98474.1 hypothetical protein CFOUR_10455 [Corynebacterium fournieri]
MDESWASTIAQVVSQEYPAAMHHVQHGPGHADPRELHPAFWGSYDWHSCVHMLCSAVKLHGRDSDLGLSALLDQRLTPYNIAAEADYLREHPLYERPYGWAWAMQLVKVCRDTRWEDALAPLEAQLEHNIAAWLRTQQWPVRHGVHSNSALALLLIFDASPRMRPLVERTALDWFGAERAYPHEWEVSGHDFVSNGLAEAALMRRVLPESEFDAWLQDFFAPEAYTFYTAPIQVNDPEDGQQAHLIGLMLTRAWLLREIGKPDGTQQLIDAAAAHLTGTNFMATHWLITYALLAEDALGN